MKKDDIKQNIILVVIGLVSILLVLELIVRKFNLAPSVIENIGAYHVVDNPKIAYGLMPGAKLYGDIINKQAAGHPDRKFLLDQIELNSSSFFFLAFLLIHRPKLYGLGCQLIIILVSMFLIFSPKNINLKSTVGRRYIVFIFYIYTGGYLVYFLIF